MFQAPQARSPEEDGNEQISMKHLVIPFSILCIGLLLASTSFLVEIFTKKRNSSIQGEAEPGTQPEMPGMQPVTHQEPNQTSQLHQNLPGMPDLGKK